MFCELPQAYSVGEMSVLYVARLRDLLGWEIVVRTLSMCVVRHINVTR